MNWTCPACATTNRDGDAVCMVCQTARPAAPTTSTVPVVGVVAPTGVPSTPTAGPEPASAPNGPRPGPAAPPPAPPFAPYGAPPVGGRDRRPWIVLAIVLVVAVVGIGAVVLIANGSDSPSGGTTQEADEGSTGSGSRPDAGEEPPVEDAPDPSTSPPPTAAVTATTLDTEPYDRWVTVLHSRSKDEFGLDQVVAEAAAMAADHGDDTRVRVIDSDATRHMRPGYWVIILVDFGTRAEAISWCESYGIAVGDCYARQTLTGALDG